jgi:hypothetical protein
MHVFLKYSFSNLLQTLGRKFITVHTLTLIHINIKMAEKEWSAVYCIPLEEPNKMLPGRMSVKICAVVEIIEKASRKFHYVFTSGTCFIQ